MTVFYTILAIAALIILHELGHFLAAKFFGMRVDEFGIGFPPRIFGKKIGETVYSVNALPLGGFVKIHGEMGEEASTDDPRSFISATPLKRAVVIIAGVVMNFITGWLLISSVFFIGTPTGILVENVQPGSPAEVAGIQKGDFIEDFSASSEFISFIESKRGGVADLKIRRGGEIEAIAVAPREVIKEGEGAIGVVIAEAGVEPHSLFDSLARGLKTSFQIMNAVLGGLIRIVATIFSEGKLVEGFVGPVGVFGIAAQSFESGIMFFVQLLGLISLNLAMLNVLPFPALDGGRFLFILIEKIKGSRLSPKVEVVANATGFILLISLILAVTVRDVSRLF